MADDAARIKKVAQRLLDVLDPDINPDTEGVFVILAMHTEEVAAMATSGYAEGERGDQMVVLDLVKHLTLAAEKIGIPINLAGLDEADPSADDDGWAKDA